MNQLLHQRRHASLHERRSPVSPSLGGNTNGRIAIPRGYASADATNSSSGAPGGRPLSFGSRALDAIASRAEPAERAVEAVVA